MNGSPGFWTIAALRASLMGAALVAWYWTQKRIGRRPASGSGIVDRFHVWSAGWNRTLHERPALADGLLIASSFLVDSLGGFTIVYSVVGPSVRPLLALLLIFGLRQLCQTTTALPPPSGILWRDPGFPSFLVTYGVSNDLFFSGHTAISVLGALVLHSLGIPALTTVAVLIAAFEMVVVIALRAHYTLDVFTGAVVAFWIWSASHAPAGAVDRLFAQLAAR